jgi:calcineurin-like phosphoesterase
MQTDKVLRRFVERIPERFEPASGRGSVCGVIIEIDEIDGKSVSIKRVRMDED